MTTTTEKYRPIAKVGAGGMASVELAVMSSSGGINKLLVVKKLLAHLAKDPSYVAMFVNEARVAARLSHPNVVSTYEVGSDGEVPFIVMEYLEGQSLSALFRRLGRPQVSIPHQLHVLRGLLAGLEYAHTLVDFDGRALELVHRDVSPQNAFVCYDGRVKLVDFGIAKVNGLGGDAKPGVLKGKIAYMAPEQLRGDEVDCRADVYSIGIMLWEALAGRRMTLGEPEATVVTKRKRGEIPDLAPYNPLVAAALKAVCAKALAFSREERYASANDMLTALDEAIVATGNLAIERELGAFVADSFGAERARIQSVIETQLKSFTIAPAAPVALPELERVEPSLGGALSSEDGKSSSTAGSGPVSLNQPGGLNGEVSLPPPSAEEEPILERPRRKTGLWGASLAAVAVLAGVGWLAASGSSRSAPSPALPKSRAPAASATASTSVRLVVHATPERAVLILDGKQLSGNPATLQVTKDDRPHVLRVQTSRSHVERAVLFDRDQSLEIGLPAEPSSTAGTAPHRTEAASSRDSETAAPSRGTSRSARPRRTLDEQNPY